jgi:type I site-specific restriction-modification system R (restriction) subunit
VNLIDFENPGNNRYVISTQFTYRAKVERRFDLVLLVNGIPLVIGEAKTPSRPAVTWVDGAAQIHDDYEINVPAMFAPTVFSFATEGKTYRFGSVRMPLDIWAPWRDTVNGNSGLQEVKQAVLSMLTPETILRILQHFTVFATDRKKRKIKLICRYQQYEAGNQIVDRVVAGRPKKGLIWHFQGSGKSLLMVFAAQRLRGHAALGSPTVLIVVDRIDLDTQITGTFNATDVPNTIWAALSPDPCLGPCAEDYRWLTQVYESVKPPSGIGKLLWAALGAKTVELIHQNVHVETVRDDLETLVMDEEILENFLSSKDPKKTVEIEFRIISRLRRLKNHPKFIELSKRLEDLKARHEKGLLTSIEFLKQLLALAKDVVAAEKETPPEEAEDRGKAALTDLFKEIRNEDTPVVVERIVGDIDAIVKVVRFPGWQQTIAGEREVQKALRKTLLKYQLHHEQELFDKAYAYVKQYY